MCVPNKDFVHLINFTSLSNTGVRKTADIGFRWVCNCRGYILWKSNLTSLCTKDGSVLRRLLGSIASYHPYRELCTSLLDRLPKEFVSGKFGTKDVQKSIYPALTTVSNCLKHNNYYSHVSTITRALY